MWLNSHDPKWLSFKRPLTEADFGQTGIFVFFDHGKRDFLEGSDKHNIIDIENVKLLKNKFIYSISCWSASNLGHTAIIKGAKGYIGFNDQVYIMPEASKIIGHCLTTGLVGIVDNNLNAAQARQSIVTKLLFYAAKIGLNGKLPQADRDIFQNACEHNRDYLIHLGDPNWNI